MAPTTGTGGDAGGDAADDDDGCDIRGDNGCNNGGSSGGGGAVIAAVEAGGTSFTVAICRVSASPAAAPAEVTILDRTSIPSSYPTTTPTQTLEAVCDFLRSSPYKLSSSSSPSRSRSSSDGGAGVGVVGVEGGVGREGGYDQGGNDQGGYDALGLASFGPLGVNPANKETYGRILDSSPKKEWRGIDLLGPLVEACRGDDDSSDDGGDDSSGEKKGKKRKKKRLRIKVDTDVNAPALAEFVDYNNNLHGNNNTTPKISSLAYITAGTGIGVGLVVNSQPVHGRLHPEGGHVPVQPLEGDEFGGYSWGRGVGIPFEGRNTVEGLGCTVALTERYGQMLLMEEDERDRAGGGTGIITTSSSGSRGNNKADATDSTGATDATIAIDRSILATLPNDHHIWDHAANALANLCTTLLLTLSIERIVMGGGLMNRVGLLERIHLRTAQLVNGYLDLPDVQDMGNRLIVRSRYGGDAGLMGTIALAKMALLEEEDEDDGLEEEDDVRVKEERRRQQQAMKRAAFNTGLWNGVLVGAIGAGLVCKYCLYGSGGSRRR